MAVAFFENGCTGFTTLAINVRVGSDDERKDYGISHFLEHMLFTGTKTRNEVDIVDAIESVGGKINADTSETKTIYFAQVPAGNEDVLADVLSDMLLNPSILERNVKKEKGIISSEISNTFDDPFEHSDMATRSAMLGKPTTIGTRKDVSSMTLEKLVDFYKTWYVPNNMTAIVVGNRNAFDAVFRVIEKNFSPKPRARLPPRQALSSSVPPKNYRHATSIDDVYVTMAVPVRGFSEDPRGNFALDLLVSVLDRPMSGRLNIALRIKNGLVYKIYCDNLSARDYGIFKITFSTSRKNIEKTKERILREIERTVKIPEPELESSKNHLAGEVKRSFEDGIELAYWAGTWDALGDISLASKYVDMIRRVTPADIQRARKLLEGRWLESVVG